jgi:hypothetical protein
MSIMANGTTKSIRARTGNPVVYFGADPKEHRPKLEPRILLEDPSKPYCASTRITDHDIFDKELDTLAASDLR